MAKTMKTKEPDSYVAFDGIQRRRTEDEHISNNVSTLFNSELGREVLHYLKGIRVNAVSGPNISDGELRHLEGQRYIVGLIDRRLRHGNVYRSGRKV